MNNVKNNNNSSSLPLLIIGAVLLAAIVGGWWFYSSSTAPTKKSTANTPVSKSPTPNPEDIYNDAAAKAPGAQPANMLGSPTATVTVEEFADYQCPTCATVHPKIQEITKLYGNRIKFVYRSFPLVQMHPYAYDAAVAAEAAGLQDKFWEMQNQLFPNQQEWATSPDARKVFEGYAQKIGLDVAKYQNDVLGLAAKARVDADLQRGRALKINGTPSIYINGKSLPFEQFTVEAMQKAIDAEMQKSNGQPSGQASNQATVVNQTSGGANAASKSDGEKK